MRGPVVARGALFGLGVALALLLPQGVQGQGGVLPGTPERERQEVLLPALGVLEIDGALRARLGLFPGVEGFRVARLFLLEGGGAVLEVEWTEGGILRRERRRLTEEELEGLRQELSAQVAGLGAGAVASREGRGGLVLGHTALGLGWHGWAVPAALELDSSRAQVAAYLLTAGAAFYLPYRLTRNRGVSEAHRSLSLYGGTRGILTGVFLGDLFIDPDDPEVDAGRVRLGGGVLGGVTGSLVGYMLVERAMGGAGEPGGALGAGGTGGQAGGETRDRGWPGGVPTRGDAELWGAFGDAGYLAGAATAYLAGPYRTREVEVREGDVVWIDERTRNRRAGHLVTLAGHGAGLALGGWLSTRRSYSAGDVAVLRSTAVLGVQSGATLARLGGADDGIPYVAGMLAGGAAGMVAGDRWAGPRGLGTGEGLLVNAGHLAGAATALGVTYLVVDEVDGNETAMLLSSTLGGFVGAGLVWRAVGEGHMRMGTRIRVSLHPQGILSGVLHPAEPRGREAGAGFRPSAPTPTWLSVHF